jgi:branched-chain amino acid transport system ATP-binding protein
VAGLNDAEVENFEKILERIQSMGITIVLVEHHMGFVLGNSDEIVVLNYGVKIAEGTPQEIQNNEDVIAAYLGKGTQHAQG